MVTVAELMDPGNYYFWIITITIIFAILGILKGKIRMLFTITSFAYPNAKFNAIGNDYVKRIELEALIEARNLQDAAGILGTKNYPLKDVRTADETEKVLDEYNIKLLENILQDIPAGLKPLVHIYLKKYEVNAIKRVLKTHISEIKRSEEGLKNIRPVGELTSDILQQMFEAERADEVAELFARTPFGKELREAIHDYDGNFQKIENILDKYVYSELQKANESVSNTVAIPTRSFVDHLLDISNIKMLLRAKRRKYNQGICKNMLYPHGLALPTWKLEQMCEASDVVELLTELEGTKYYAVIKDLIPLYEKNGDVSQLEIALDKYLLRLVVEISIQHTITAGPTIRYMVSREYESRNLKTILRGLDEGLDHKRIMPLLITEEEE